jgi:hypothetical protein
MSVAETDRFIKAHFITSVEARISKYGSTEVMIAAEADFNLDMPSASSSRES